MRLVRTSLASLALAPLALALLAQEPAPSPTAGAQEPSGDRFARTGSRAPHAHHLTLYDRDEQPIDPSAPHAKPYSPARTCGRCHDLATIAHGWHFAALRGEAERAQPHGRAGEPWIYVDPRTGTALPLSPRGGVGRFDPAGLGIGAHELAQRFARHLPGGLGPAANAGAEELAAWAKSGELEIDCMSCHDAGNQWNHLRWIEQIERGNFAWASSAALGLAAIDGVAPKLGDGIDPLGAQGVKTAYDARAFSPRKEVFFDVVRTPHAEACYRCHTTRDAAPTASSRWLQEEDVHLRAGMSCADCHGHGLDHGNVRGYDGEVHPAGKEAAAFSCRGCHLDAEDLPAEQRDPQRARAGRFGAPRPAHAGLPPLHLEQLSCTACHSGPLPEVTARAQQTSLAHALGKDLHELGPEIAPPISAPVFARNDRGVIEPQRWTWPAYFGYEQGESIHPFPPAAIAAKVRKAVRVKQDFAAELADPKAFEEKIAKALAELAKEPAAEGGRAVYLANGLVHRLSADGAKLERAEHPAAAPVAWPLAHDVRPARQALGASGCQECHASEAPFFHAEVVARGPAPVEAPPRTTNAALQGQDPVLLAAWEQSFETRPLFKWAAAISCGLVLLVLVTHAVLALLDRRRATRERSS